MKRWRRKGRRNKVGENRRRRNYKHSTTLDLVGISEYLRFILWMRCSSKAKAPLLLDLNVVVAMEQSWNGNTVKCIQQLAWHSNEPLTRRRGRSEDLDQSSRSLVKASN